MRSPWPTTLRDRRPHGRRGPARSGAGRNVRRAWAAGSNLLLNVAPRADGVIPPREQELLRAVGARLRTE
ncbi:alpha-L-fucosidase [Streptomyces sp. NPDC001292]|uniref:alpha-L-fucosidase n=1 Tax=Streptomyces sp. NPDC001292 TaxID=3364558 RepID=UPI0036865F2F